MRIILTGFRGTGKTAIGQALAQALALPFIDTDAEIAARAGMDIPSLFDQRGESGFRNLEKDIIRILPSDGAVVSTGGGAILDPQNVEALRAGSTIILLSADPETILHRIRDSKRPSLTPLPMADEIRHLLKIRDPLYRNAADFCIDTRSHDIPDIVRTLLRLLREEDVPFEKVRHALDVIPPLNHEDRAILEERTEEGSPLRICAVIGNPVAHSRSPLLFNGLFVHYHLLFRYIRMASPDAGALLTLAQIRNFRGLSVTIPHKKAVLPLLDSVDPVAETIGAVNTIVFCGGKSYGYNTDWLGIRHPLASQKGKKVAILGAGGAAVAAIYACQDLGMEITLLNRTPDRAAILAERFGCDAAPLERFPFLKPEVVINATPVGMEPDTHTPIPGEWLHPEMTVFDLVYTPPRTPLLREAEKRGCSIISGVQMFIHQAREQCTLFTGITPPVSLIQELIS